MKKLISLMICLLLIISISVPAFASETENNTPSDHSDVETQAPPAETEPPSSETQAPPAETDPPSTETQAPSEETAPPSTNPPAGTEAPEGHIHVWGTGTVTTEATCTTDGIRTYICSCGTTATETIRATGHTYDNVCDPECNTCKATREIQHNTTGWHHSWEGHWRSCTLCKAKLDFGNHFAGPAATEEQDQLCLTCGMVLTPKKSHQHSYSTKWTSDETGHWYACESCQEKKDFNYHEYDDLCDPDCNICGFASPTAHSFDETWSHNEEGHWSFCVLCDEKTPVEAHTADPNVPETEAQLCTVCGYELAPAKEHVHEGAPHWSHDGESHWKICQCGEILDKVPHSWDAGTENEDTTITYRCSDCGAEMTEGEPKEPASFSLTTLLAILLAGCAAVAVVLSLVLHKGNKKNGRFVKN